MSARNDDRRDALREAVIATALAMNAAGINRGKSGNVSARWRDDGFDGFLVTPSGLPYAETTPDDIVAVTLDGRGARPRAALVGVALSSRHLSRSAHDAHAVVHAHAPFATSLACLAARHSARSTTWSRSPAAPTFAARRTRPSARRSCPITRSRRWPAATRVPAGQPRHDRARARRSHAALALAVEVETLAEMYWRALQVGEPILLGDEEMEVVLEKFATYGQPDGPLRGRRRRSTTPSTPRAPRSR